MPDQITIPGVASALKTAFSKFTVTGAQKAHIDRLLFEMGDFEKKYGLALEDNSQLESDINDLRIKLEDSERIRSELETKLREKKYDDRTSKEHEILLVIADHSDDGPTTQEIADHIGAGIQVAFYHLKELEGDNFVGASIGLNRPGTWGLTQDGRRYLIQRELIQ